MNNDLIIGVTGTGSLIGQAIIKCIKHSNLKDKITLIGFDYIAENVGSYWCNKNFLLPDMFKKDIKENVWLEAIVDLILKNKIQILFVGIDFELPIFAHHKEYIQKTTNCTIVVSDENVITIANDKLLTADFLKKNNLPHPISFDLEDYKMGALDFPLIIKPRVGARSVGFNLIKNEAEFTKAINSVEKPVIQECIGNSNTEYTCGVIYLNNELKASIALSRTLKEGNTFTSNFSSNFPKEIYEYIENVTKLLKPWGVVNYQLRVDTKGVPKIFEINARHSGTTFMRCLFGYNEVEYIICSLLGLPLPNMSNLKEGKTVRFYDEFFVK